MLVTNASFDALDQEHLNYFIDVDTNKDNYIDA